MTRAWCYIEKRHVEVGARRWVVEWYDWRDGDVARDPERDPVDDSVCRFRCFPGRGRGLAVAFARRVEWEVWGPTVHEERFEVECEVARIGSWEMVGERIELDELDEGGAA